MLCAEINNAEKRVGNELEIISKAYSYLDNSHMLIICTEIKKISITALIDSACVICN